MMMQLHLTLAPPRSSRQCTIIHYSVLHAFIETDIGCNLRWNWFVQLLIVAAKYDYDSHYALCTGIMPTLFVRSIVYMLPLPPCECIHKQSNAIRKLAPKRTSMIQIVFALISLHGFSVIGAYFPTPGAHRMDVGKHNNENLSIWALHDCDKSRCWVGFNLMYRQLSGIGGIWIFQYPQNISIPANLLMKSKFIDFGEMLP